MSKQLKKPIQQNTIGRDYLTMTQHKDESWTITGYIHDLPAKGWGGNGAVKMSWDKATEAIVHARMLEVFEGINP